MRIAGLLAAGLSVARSGVTATTLAFSSVGAALIVTGARWTARLRPGIADDLAEIVDDPSANDLEDADEHTDASGAAPTGRGDS